VPKRKATPKAAPNTANLMVSVYDGTRQPISKDVNLLIRLIDGNQKQWSPNYRKGPNIPFEDVPTFDNFGDNYTVLVWAEGYIQAGFNPVKIARGAWRFVDLMLIPKDSSFNFGSARWELLRETHPALSRLLAHGTPNDAAAKERYEEMMEDRAPTLAAFLNIATATAEIQLPSGSALDYLKELDWDEMQQDRFFAYADRTLIGQVERAASQGAFAPEVGSGFFHRGATRSYKEVRFGEANVQLTFHEEDTKTIDGVSCVKVEPDIDYYKDLGAHALLEVIPNTISGRLTDPKQVYVLRWMAGRMAGVPEFDPPYTIV
jgi:hypothetical protein